MTNLDFPVVAKQQYGISVVEYVNQFFMDKAKDINYLNELLKRCNDNGVKNHLIMCDEEGPLADLDNTKRLKAVENHYKWVDAAKHLGCVTIRVNAFGDGSADDVQKAAIDGIGRLAEYAKGASAKTHEFDENGNCVETDYYKMLKIIKDSGFHGYIGIEYEGPKLSEEEGLRKTKALLEKVAASLG